MGMGTIFYVRIVKRKLHVRVSEFFRSVNPTASNLSFHREKHLPSQSFLFNYICTLTQ